MKKILILSLLIITACSQRPGPDKTVAGAVLGAGWGAGAGAVAGHQVGVAGEGAAVGAGFGLVSGALTGAGLDVAEANELKRQKQIEALKVQVAANEHRLKGIQSHLDRRDKHLAKTSAPMSKVYFDSEKASIRSGSARELQNIANQIKMNPYVGRVEIHGHSDDMGDSDRNLFLSEARSRSVATFLASQGVSLDQMDLFAYGADRPIASNENENGRQLNRRVEVVLSK